MRTSDALLHVRGVTMRHGHVEAVNDLSLQVCSGEVVSQLGAKGAGKSSLFRALSGLVSSTSESARLDGRELPLKKAHAVTRAGLIHVPEGRRVIAGI